MARNEVAELRQQVEELRDILARLTGQPQKEVSLEERADYIAQGSDQHMAWLGLQKATEEDEADQNVMTYEGYKLLDVTAFGVTAKEDYLLAVLRQKVHQLQQPIPMPQSADRNAPNYAPPMWQPEGVPVTGIVGRG